MSKDNTDMTDGQGYTRSEVAKLGEAIYQDRLRSELEKEINGRYVSIHVDSGDHVVGRSSAEAVRSMISIHPPDGRVYTRKIGNEPEYGLAVRLAGAGRSAGPK